MTDSTRDGGSKKLPAPLDRILLDPVREESVVRMWRVIATRRERAASGHGSFGAYLRVFAVVVGLVVGIVGYRLVEQRTAEIPHKKAIGALLTKDGKEFGIVEVGPQASVESIVFADASQIIVEPGARVVPLASSSTDFEVLLARGSATFSVTPGGPRRWIVEAGAARVEVVGTRFRVSRSAELVQVSVDKGVVLVRGDTVPDKVMRLEAGRTLEVPSRTLTQKGEHLSKPASEGPSGAASGATSVPSSVPSDQLPRRAVDFRRAAKLGEHKQAFAELGEEGLKRETKNAASAEDLFALADIARLSGHPEQAILPLNQLIQNYPHSAQASLASVTLGRIELLRGHADAAARMFEGALRSGAPSGLEEDVYARLVEAYVKSENPSAAKRVAKEYLRRFPNGHRKTYVESVLGAEAED